MTEDQRRFARLPLKVEIEVGESFFGGELRLDSSNVSEGGLFLKSDLLLEEGEILWISFSIPKTLLAVRTRGRVAWVARDPDRQSGEAGMGIEFLDLSDAERAALGNFLKE